MKGSVIAAHEMEEKSEPKDNKREEKRESSDCYCGEASKRFPHLTNGSNRGVKAAESSAPPKAKVETAFREVYANEPSTVTRANVHGEQKRKMMAAIAYSKARKGG
jgi:hypothetical protein